MANAPAFASYSDYPPLTHLKEKLQRIRDLLALQRQHIHAANIDALTASIVHIRELLRELHDYKRLCIRNAASARGGAAPLFKDALRDINSALAALRTLHLENRAALARLVDATGAKVRAAEGNPARPAFPKETEHILVDSKV